MFREVLLVAICSLGVSSASASDIATAARDGDTEVVRRLLAAGADVNEVQGDGTTALHWAAYNDDGEMAELLIRAGARVDEATRNGSLTPLIVAATNGSSSVVQALLRAGARPMMRTDDGATPLMMAAASGSVEAVRLLLDHGADVNARDTHRGQTALMFAAASDRGPVVRLLLERRAAVGQISTVETSLRNHMRREVSRPIKEGTDPLARIKAERRPVAGAMGGFSALHFAARDGRLNAARALVDGGADINQRSGADESTPLVTAASNGHFELARFLLDRGADPNLDNGDGVTPLYAVMETQFAPASWSPVRPTDQEKVTYLELMKVLLDRGADPNARLKKKLWYRPFDHDDFWVGTVGTTPFWRAAFANDREAMLLLVSGGADPNVASSEGTTPLMVAAGLGWSANFHRTVASSRIPAVKLCLELGADLNASDTLGYTALHGAAYRGDNDLVTFLIEHGARLDVKTIFGTSVTDMANGFVAYSSLPRVHPETVELLLKRGAPAASPERLGESAYCNAAALNCPIVEGR